MRQGPLERFRCYHLPGKHLELNKSKFQPIPLVFLSRWLADSMNNNVRFVDSMNDKDTGSSYLVT